MVAICVVSASLDCLAEDVRVLTVVIAELELGDIEGKIFPALSVRASSEKVGGALLQALKDRGT
jgi:hypothetical protein